MASASLIESICPDRGGIKLPGGVDCWHRQTAFNFHSGIPRTFVSCSTRPTGLGQTELGPTAPQEQSVWSRQKCSRITTRFGSIKFVPEARSHVIAT